MKHKYESEGEKFDLEEACTQGLRKPILECLEVDKLNKIIEHISNAQLISIENMVGKEKVSNEEQLYLSLQTEIYSHIS